MTSIALCGCNSKEFKLSPETGNTQLQSVPHTLTEYYEKDEYDTSEYISIDDIVFSNDGIYISGIKLTGDAAFANVLDTEKNEMYQINLNFSFDWIDNICILGNNAYILHDSQSIAIVDIKSGKLINEKNNFIYARDIYYDSQNIVLFNQNEGVITLWDTELNFISELSIKDLLKVPSESYTMYRMLKTENYMYITVQSEKNATLYILNDNQKIVNKKEINDLPGYIYSIYENGENVIVTSYDKSSDGRKCTYVDFINIYDDNIVSTYEIYDTQFVSYNYSNKNFICNNGDYAFNYIPSENSYEKLDESDGYINGDIKQSGKNIIFCPDINSNLKHVFSYISSLDNKNDFFIDKNVRSKGVIANQRFYCNYENEKTGDTSLAIYDNTGNIILDTELDKESDDLIDYYPAYCTNNRIYSVSCEIYSENKRLNIYNTDGEKISEYTVDNIDYLYKIISGKNCDFAWILKDGKSEIYSLTDEKALKIESLSNINPYDMFHGDNKYDLYYLSGTTLYGYSYGNSESKRIFNYLDSGLSNIGSTFGTINEKQYICSNYDSEGTKYFTLTQASDEVLEKLNSRKILVAAGECSLWDKEVSEAINKFNSESKELFIKCRDYSDFSESNEISGLNRDVINRDIPDILISYGDNDLNVLKNMDLFEELSEHLSDYNEKFIVNHSKTNETKNYYSISPSLYLVRICSIEDYSFLGSDISIEEFLDYAEKENLKFINSKEEIFRYFVLNQADSFINREESTCYFNSELFIRLLKYINTADSENGTLIINYFNDTNVAGRNLKNSFCVSKDGNTSGFIAGLPKISVFSTSRYKKEACDLIKIFLSEEYQGKITGKIPVIKDIAFSDIRLQKSEKENLLNVLENASSESVVDFSIENILIQNADDYFNNHSDLYETIDNIQKQVSIYLNETK